MVISLTAVRLRKRFAQQGVPLTPSPVCPKCGCSVSPKGWDSHLTVCDPPKQAA